LVPWPGIMWMRSVGFQDCHRGDLVSAGSWRSAPLPPGWGRLRTAVLARDPVCTWGMLIGEEGPCGQDSTEADHIGDPSDHRVEAMRGLCRPHHMKRTSNQAVAVRTANAARRLRPREPHPGFVREGDMLLCLHSFQSRRPARQGMARRHVRLVMAWEASMPMPARHAMARVLCLRTGSPGTGRLTPMARSIRRRVPTREALRPKEAVLTRDGPHNRRERHGTLAIGDRACVCAG
jgi:hypothetical protein